MRRNMFCKSKALLIHKSKANFKILITFLDFLFSLLLLREKDGEEDE
jgi:hypothetical protein